MNPYESPATVESSKQRGSPRPAVLAVVVATMLVNGRNVVRNWPALTIVHHLIGIFLWVVLPLLAVWLVWRGRSAGRWLLVSLFGLRATISLAELLFVCGRVLTMRPTLIFTEPYRTSLLDMAVFGGAAGWLLFSAAFRRRNVVIH